MVLEFPLQNQSLGSLFGFELINKDIFEKILHSSLNFHQIELIWFGRYKIILDLSESRLFLKSQSNKRMNKVDYMPLMVCSALRGKMFS